MELEIEKPEEKDKPKKSNKRKRQAKKEKQQRRGRIIIRNLSFKTTEEKLRKHFEEFGTIVDLKILKRPDGKLVGCAFVQYEVVQHAARAIHHRTGKEFLGRPIICDWAIPKDTYLKHNSQQEVKDEPIEIKEDPEDVVEIKETISEKKESDSNSESDDKSSVSDENSDSDDGEEENSVIEEPEPKKPRVVSNDVSEGKTVFFKNIPFSATNEDLYECMSQFGPIYYALICTDPITEHSKGTGFVKFRNAEDAEKCLESGTELTLMGNILDCHRAINKSDLQKKKAKTEKKDSRNLYLVKEGVILAGSPAAQTVSTTDMAKRLQLERWKTQMLRNLNMFVSKYRLVVNNLPASWDDKQLRKLVEKYVPGNTIKETRVMRNLRDIDGTGKGKSREYGFVTLETHEDALKILRALNNNPNIFTETRRPVVSFSIENKAVLNARKKRLEKSKLHNPTFNKNIPHDKVKDVAPKRKTGKTYEANNEKFGGVHAKEGEVRLRSKYKLKTQASIHHENVKKRKKLMKNQKKSLVERKGQHIRQPQQKQNTSRKKQGKKNDEDNFSKLVNQYKNKLVGDSTRKVKSKWYQT